MNHQPSTPASFRIPGPFHPTDASFRDSRSSAIFFLIQLAARLNRLHSRSNFGTIIVLIFSEALNHVEYQAITCLFWLLHFYNIPIDLNMPPQPCGSVCSMSALVRAVPNLKPTTISFDFQTPATTQLIGFEQPAYFVFSIMSQRIKSDVRSSSESERKTITISSMRQAKYQ